MRNKNPPIGHTKMMRMIVMLTMARKMVMMMIMIEMLTMVKNMVMMIRVKVMMMMLMIL